MMMAIMMKLVVKVIIMIMALINIIMMKIVILPLNGYDVDDNDKCSNWQRVVMMMIIMICGIFIPIVIIQHLLRSDSLLFLLVSSRFGFIKPWEKGKRYDHYI